MKRISYLGGSGVGGTNRVFETLRDGLASHGYIVELMNHDLAGCSTHQTGGVADSIFAEKKDAKTLVAALTDADAVIVNAFMSPRLMNVARYLPAELPRILIVHSVTFATYQAARALRGYVHHTVAVSPRIRSDLIKRYGFRPDRITTIFHGVPDSFFEIPLERKPDGVARVLSLGRIEHASKGILDLPKIFDASFIDRARLTIAGDGPDRAALLERLRGAGIPIDYLGVVSRAQLMEVYSEEEIFLFPSRFEGMGIALAEAMAAGLAPVAARISGVTSAILESSDSDPVKNGIGELSPGGGHGMLFGQGDLAAANAALARLINDPSLRREMRHRARARAEQLFRMNRMMAGYSAILDSVIAQPDLIRPLRLEEWSIPRRMRPGLRAFLPPLVRRAIGNMLIHRGGRA